MRPKPWYPVALTVLLVSGCAGVSHDPPRTPSSTSQSSQPTPTTPSTEDALACKLAMVKQFQDALNGGKMGTRPEECKGIDDATVENYAEEILTEVLGGTDTATP